MKYKSFLSEDQVILNWCLGLYADLMRMKAAGLLLLLLVQKKNHFTTTGQNLCLKENTSNKQSIYVLTDTTQSIV